MLREAAAIRPKNGRRKRHPPTISNHPEVLILVPIDLWMVTYPDFLAISWTVSFRGTVAEAVPVPTIAPLMKICVSGWSVVIVMVWVESRKHEQPVRLNIIAKHTKSESALFMVGLRWLMISIDLYSNCLNAIATFLGSDCRLTPKPVDGSPSPVVLP